MCNQKPWARFISRSLCVPIALQLGISARAQTGTAQPFHFTPADESLLEVVNAIDRQLEHKGLIYTDPRMDAYVTGLASTLLAGVTAPERVTFKFHVVRDPTVNALSFPNGSIYINGGLVAALADEVQLASVMAHEISHVVTRDAYLHNRTLREKAAERHTLAIGAAVGGAFLFGAGSVLFDGPMQSFADKSPTLFAAATSGYPDDMEWKADRYALSRLIAAGYGSTEFLRTLDRLSQQPPDDSEAAFWTTREKLQRRLAAIKNPVDTGLLGRSQAVLENDYLSASYAIIVDTATADFDVRRAQTGVGLAQRLVDWHSQDAPAITLLADGYRALGALASNGQPASRRRERVLTEQEEQKQLLSTTEGREALASNRSKAESLYFAAIAANPNSADPHRGLGMLYQEEARLTDAEREYREYLRLTSPKALDRLRIERRPEDVTERPAGGSQ